MNYDEQDFNNAEKLVRGRQFFSRRPKQMGNVVAQLMARKGYGQEKSNAELSTAWQNIVGERFKNQTSVGTIRRGVLEVIVGNSLLNQRLEFEKKRLLTELNNRLPQIKLKNIRFRIGNQ